MKRSEINKTIRWAIDVFRKNHFELPSFAYWTMEQWNDKSVDTTVLRKTLMGWDIADFDSGNFERVGASALTIRNGLVDRSAGTPYAEKIIVVKEKQIIPLHYHVTKQEDIINRGGGLLCIQLFNSKPDGSVDKETDVEVYCDGVKKYIKAGDSIEITTGNSITIRPYLYHLFHIKPGSGDTVIGEVSSVNDDKKDNYFAEKRERFSYTEEDEPIDIPQCTDVALK
ncbi:MAG TPA: D-lyxose/D-mannose family sugar isomerase [Desulfitobacteriaceae bacterium]|nr:D-lyxose/D-mannose family sugar isomerase [Desulfitobacteriaceae bacterium]